MLPEQPIVAAGGISVTAATDTITTAATQYSLLSSSAAGMLRFLARLSGRRRHVRRFSNSSSSKSCAATVVVVSNSSSSSSSFAASPSRPGAITTTTTTTTTSKSKNSTAVPAGELTELRVVTAESSETAAMELHHHKQQEEIYINYNNNQEVYCSRCRGSSCSCSLLGLDDHEINNNNKKFKAHHQINNDEDNNNINKQVLNRSKVISNRLNNDGLYGCIKKVDNCACVDRDVLRRRPPEQHKNQQQQQQQQQQKQHNKIYKQQCSNIASTTTNNHTTTTTTTTSSTFVSNVRSSLRLVLPHYLATLLILFFSFISMADACSSRSTPKPRPPTPTPRPNITFHMYTCPPDYAEWYCLNGATCFTVKIVDSLLYNCLCANGYIGQRCEFKDLDGSYLPSRQRVMLETASIAGAVTIAVFLAVITFISIYIHCKRKQKELRTSSGVDAVDGPGRDPELRPFCSRMIFIARNSNSSAPSIEQTRMPIGWNLPAESSTRMASVNENNRSRQ